MKGRSCGAVLWFIDTSGVCRVIPECGDVSPLIVESSVPKVKRSRLELEVQVEIKPEERRPASRLGRFRLLHYCLLGVHGTSVGKLARGPPLMCFSIDHAPVD
jgi:hypothetical protein